MILLNYLPDAGLSGQESKKINDIIYSIEHMRSTGQAAVSSDQNIGSKCGLGLWFDVQRNWKNFSSAQRSQLQNILSEPSRQKKRVIGRFQIFYDTLGSYKPALIDQDYHQIPNTTEIYIDSVGEYFNDVWDYEIDSLGYSPPPINPDGTYHIIISHLSLGFYGVTWPDSIQFYTGSSFRYSTYIEIDNDFSTVYAPTRGIPALKVTAAHEFHHAIQLGSYGSWDDDRYFYEVTSVWMEDEVYNDVNDYYQYLTNNTDYSSQFSHPEIRFTEYNYGIEYSRGIWGKFLEHRFSRDIIKRTWEFMRNVPSIQALDNALAEAGSSFKSAFLEYSYWNINTGPEADTVTYYPEGKHYPKMILRPQRTYFPPAISVIDSIQAISSVYQPIQVQAQTMLAIVSNVNVLSQYLSTRQKFVYTLADAGSSGSKHLANGVYAAMNVSDPENWISQETVPSIVNEIIVYPSPFTPRNNKPINFRLPSAVQSTATLSIFSSSMARFFSGELPVLSPRPFEPVVTWNAHDDRDNIIPTGIYFYVINIDGNEYVGKFSVIRE